MEIFGRFSQFSFASGQCVVLSFQDPTLRKIAHLTHDLNYLFRKLRCPRNTLHMHLFVSFMLRAFMALLKDSLFIDGIGLPNSIQADGSFFHEKSVSRTQLFFLPSSYG